jgi:hypothetical protein
MAFSRWHRPCGKPDKLPFLAKLQPWPAGQGESILALEKQHLVRAVNLEIRCPLERSVADTDFEKRVKQFANTENAVDWAAERNWWIQQVHELFNQIEGWLRPLIDSGPVTFSRTKIQLDEEDLGRYSIDSLELWLSGRKLTFKPVGTMLIGAFGRIDISGPNGKAVLLLRSTDDKVQAHERRAHAAWFISPPAPAPGVRVSPRSKPEPRQFDLDSFQQMFTDLFGIYP